MKFTGLILTCFLFFISCFNCQGQIPKIGDSLKLEIANWNIEWFGKTGYGPNDEELQQANVLDVVQKADLDIWAFCEVSDNAVFNSIK